MEFIKPKTSKIEERAELAYQFMRGKDYVTKQQLCKLFDWDYPSKDRNIRDVISVCSQKYPIISSSDTNKGFKLAKSNEDLEKVHHSIAELLSRINEMEKRITPLHNFTKNVSSPKVINQIELF